MEEAKLTNTGRGPKIIQMARKQVANFIDAEPYEVVVKQPKYATHQRARFPSAVLARAKAYKRGWIFPKRRHILRLLLKTEGLYGRRAGAYYVKKAK